MLVEDHLVAVAVQPAGTGEACRHQPDDRTAQEMAGGHQSHRAVQMALVTVACVRGDFGCLEVDPVD